MEKFEMTNGRKVTINIVAANVFSIILLIASAIIFTVPFYLIWNKQAFRDGQVNHLWFFPLFLAGIVAHELLHGIGWSLYAKNGWKSISFGVMWKMLTPYCHCNEPLGKRPYMIGALMPLVVLGIIPAIVSLFIGNMVLLVWGIIFIAAAAGDIWMAWLLHKEDSESTILDHPNEAGFYVFPKENINTPTKEE